ncbi:hypothetical protein DIZ76_015148 [Coccidioides immitis]|nr:hypothetical protein DIZ76_015148 [Coccidioides immitis]
MDNYVIFNDNFCARAQKRAGIYNQYGFQAVPISQGESLRSMPEKKIPVHRGSARPVMSSMPDSGCRLSLQGGPGHNGIFAARKQQRRDEAVVSRANCSCPAKA